MIKINISNISCILVYSKIYFINWYCIFIVYYVVYNFVINVSLFNQICGRFSLLLSNVFILFFFFLQGVTDTSVESTSLDISNKLPREMAQGKLKVKTKLLASVKTKANKSKKGPAIKKRASKLNCEKEVNCNDIPLIFRLVVYYIVSFRKVPLFNQRRQKCRKHRN